MYIRFCVLAAIGIAVSAGPARAQVHGHLNAGAYGTSQGDQLYFVNGPDFVDSSGYVKTLTYTNAGRFAGYFQGNITLTALAATPAHGGPEPNAPALGSFLQYTIAMLEGPAGSKFGFWENGSTSPTLSLSPGESLTNLVRLTEADGSPGSDPYGHIHGRRFTATKAGIYKVAFRVYDTSTNGVGGGPIHTPSDSPAVYFQAGINVASISRTGAAATVRYGSMTNAAYTLEYTTNVTGNVWLPAAGPQFGNELFQELQDTAATNETRFYRIVSEPVEP